MKHLTAARRAAKAAGLTADDRCLPLLELVYTLARQMDAADGAPSSRLSAAYLSSLKDLNKATGVVDPSHSQRNAKPSELDLFRQKHIGHAQ